MLISPGEWEAPRAANYLSKILNAYSTAHSTNRFPVDVVEIALECASIFKWDDPITEIKAADIDKFEGGLFPGKNKKSWLLLYNSSLDSQGRIRFTQAHELGHYILHRHLKDSFECTSSDMLDSPENMKTIESQADSFASYLLMPLDDFRNQINTKVTLDLLGLCADRYGVSLTAAILKWLSYTDEKAVLVMSNDGFINWAWSSDPAFRAGAYYKTRNNIIPIPEGSLAANDSVTSERLGQSTLATSWFKHADKNMALREMKIYSNQYDSVLTLLCLPQSAEVWPPRRQNS